MEKLFTSHSFSPYQPEKNAIICRAVRYLVVTCLLHQFMYTFGRLHSTGDMVFEPGPDVVETSETHSVLLPCVVNGQPEPLVSWRHNKTKIKTGIDRSQVVNLPVRSARMLCSKNVSGTEYSLSVYIKRAIYGNCSPVMSRCLFSEGGRFHQQANGLFIYNVTYADKGLYFCQGHVPSIGQVKEKAIELILLGKL
jgi:Immunoglobulin I-set domain